MPILCENGVEVPVDKHNFIDILSYNMVNKYLQESTFNNIL